MCSAGSCGGERATARFRQAAMRCCSTLGSGSCSKPSSWRRESGSPRWFYLVTPVEFRFRPRFVALPILAGVVGSICAIWRPWTLLAPLFTIAYFLSPAWRLRVVVDEDELKVVGTAGVKFTTKW